MNKELRKIVEAELAKVVTSALTDRDQKAAAQITKHISEGVKSIAKKFVKHVPPTVTANKSPKSVKRKTASKKSTARAKKKTTRAKTKSASKAKSPAPKQ